MGRLSPPHRRGGWLSRPIELPVRRVAVRAPVGAVIDDLRSRLTAMPTVICRDHDTVVASFSGDAGPYRWHTVEAIRFTADSVTFEHLAGPFRDCTEVFGVRPGTAGTTIVEHRGSLVMKLGPIGWVFGRLVARRAFDRIIARELQALADRLSPTANPAGRVANDQSRTAQ